MPGKFEELGYDSGTRMVMYYGICLPVRLALTYTIWKHHDTMPFGWTAIILAAVSIYMNLRNIDEDVWWCRRCNALVAFMVLYLKFTNQTQCIAPLMIFMILYGFVVSFNRW